MIIEWMDGIGFIFFIELKKPIVNFSYGWTRLLKRKLVEWMNTYSKWKNLKYSGFIFLKVLKIYLLDSRLNAGVNLNELFSR